VSAGSATREDLNVSYATSAGGARSILKITCLDYDRHPMDHERVPYLTPSDGCLTLIYKRHNDAPGLGAMLRDALTMRIRRRREGGVDLICVDPPLNFRGGIRFNAESGIARRDMASRVRLALIRLLSPLAAIRDLFTVPAMLYAALLSGSGRWDACIGVGPWGALTGLALRRLGRVRVLAYRDQDFEPGLLPEGFRRGYTAWAERFTLRRADLVISTAALLVERRRSETQCPIHLVPNGVDWGKFAGARARPAPDPTLVYVGILVPWSGVENAIEAMVTIRRSLPRARLLIAGGGLPAYEQRLRQRIETLDLEDAVELLGPLPAEDVPALLARARVSLANSEPVPFRVYACPLKVMESMAAGLPIIVTTGTEAQRIVERHECGLAVPYAVQPLAEALLALLGNKTLHARMRFNGIRASEDLDWGRQVAREMALISRRLEQCSGPIAN